MKICLLFSLAMALALTGCQASTQNNNLAKEDAGLRAIARAYGVKVPEGTISTEWLVRDIVARADTEIDAALEEVAKTSGTKAKTEVQVELKAMLTHAQKSLQLIATNVANAHTAGYRRATPDHPRTKAGMVRDMAQGSLISTGRQLDVALTGSGFLICMNPKTKQRAYTRAGNFFIDAEGHFVCGSQDAWVLDPPITVPNDTTAITISQDGRVFAISGSNPAPAEIGQIQLAVFRDPERLATSDGVHFTPSPESGDPLLGNPGTASRGMLQQHALEESNVDPTHEIMAAIRIQRWVRALQRAIVLTQ